MKYLSYQYQGFLKKFPIKSPVATIGRSDENSLAIDDTYISRQHLRIEEGVDFITITDLDSANGTFFKGERIKNARIELGESFIIGRIEMCLQEGNQDEFNVTEKFNPVFSNLTPSTPFRPHHRDTLTEFSYNTSYKLLEDILSQGMKIKDITGFISYLSTGLSHLQNFNSILLASKMEEDIQILFSLENLPEAMTVFTAIIAAYPEVFHHVMSFTPFSLPGKQDVYFHAVPFTFMGHKTCFIYIAPQSRKREDWGIEKFLTSLAKEVELIAHMHEERNQDKKSRKTKIDVNLPEQKKNEDKKDVNFPDDIVAASPVMKRLIQQAKKIAGSNIFVLIEGESGTGKELFARLIHKYSRRSRKQFIALNCAAIPENLLESELFGHEKGAFTGAYTQRKGKLELASEGTLVLDEIGDMPLNLQSKLLRALQENEFYRLGGSTPIKVDLRIISITHQNLKQLIKEKRFREDLYYRLVHRSLYIPPLRERPEDIPLLINFFTHRYCRLNHKTVTGYAIKAFETLHNHHWRGNVRQLENEINSLVNLMENEEIIQYDMLSDEIKYGERTGKNVDNEALFPEEGVPNTINTVLPPAVKDTDAFSLKKFHEKPDKDIILKTLQQNRWNKAQTARALNMTYQGLHKKMTRLGINKNDQSPKSIKK